MKRAFSCLTLVLAILAAGCGTSSTTTTSPSLDRCSVSVANSTPSIGPSGGNGRLTVTAGRECTWAVTSNVSWITPRPPAGAQGDGAVEYIVAENPSADARRGTVTVGGQSLEVVQEGASCRFNIQPNSQNVEAAGGNGSFTVDGPSGCSWTPTASDDWITITNGGSRSGNGAVNFSVTANAGASRVGAVRVGGQLFSVLQDAPSCRFVLSAVTGGFSGAGGSGSVAVTGPRTCSWTASSNVPWISIVSAVNGSGSGAVSFAVQSNPGAARIGVLTIGGQRFTVTQLQAECSYSIAPAGQSFTTSGGTGSVAVSTSSLCTWTASDVPTWITGMPPTGTGAQTLAFNVEPNAGPARTATIIIGGQTFSVSQAAGCTYSLTPTNHNPSASGGASTVTVNTAAGCTWTSSGVPSWIAGVPASGTGPQTINFTIGANSGPARSTNFVVAGETFSVSQSGGCGFTVTPGSYSSSATASSSIFAVTTAPGCAWTSSGVPSWITGVPASDTGSRVVSFNVAANTGAARSATISIGGQTFTVDQAGGCSYSLAPSTHNPAAGGGASSFAINTAAGCSWTSSGVPSWITGVPASGSGTQTINFTVGANSGATRTANIVVGGETFTVTQAAVACSYSVAPSSYSAPAGGGSSSFDMTTQAGCDWTTTSGSVPSWITGIPASGSGADTINFTVAANPNPALRTANIMVGGQTFTVTQAAAACQYSLDPASRNVSAAGGSSSFEIDTAAGCDWSSSGVPSWITGVPTNGSGDTTVNFTVAANTGPARTATIVVEGKNLTVNQANGCTYAVSPDHLTFDASAGPSQNVALTTGASCPWTATADRPWITIVSGNSGPGPETIKIELLENTDGNARQGTIAVGGETITITQNP
jgi:hypothetical protein